MEESMEFNPQSISSLLAGMAGGILIFSLMSEARDNIRAEATWRVLPIPPLEIVSYIVMALAVASSGRGLGALVVSLIVMPSVMFAVRVVWILGRRTEDDPIRRGLEALERRYGGRERP